jgi:L-alanine-DL-glutamate epimerase-like enolase superfamily enzyme
VHLDVAIPNFVTQEYTLKDEAEANRVFVTDCVRQGGHIPAPETPGLGVSLDEGLLAERPFRAMREGSPPLRADGSVGQAV